MVVHRVCMRSRMEEEKTVFSFLLFCFLSSVWDWRYYDLMHWKLSILDISAPRPKGFARQYYASRNDIFWHKILPNTVRLEIQYIWQDIPKYIWVHFYGKSGKSKSRLGGRFRKGGWFICALTKGWQLHQNALYPLIHSPLCPHVPPPLSLLWHLMQYAISSSHPIPSYGSIYHSQQKYLSVSSHPVPSTIPQGSFHHLSPFCSHIWRNVPSIQHLDSENQKCHFRLKILFSRGLSSIWCNNLTHFLSISWIIPLDLLFILLIIFDHMHPPLPLTPHFI